MPDFGKIVPHLDNPLAVAGLALFLVVGLLRLALGLRVFQQITPYGTQFVILRVLFYAFILALVGMVGGFGLAAYQASLIGKSVTGPASKIEKLVAPQVVAVPQKIEQIYPRVTRIREGPSGSPQRRLFDITIENTVERQVTLDTFRISWRYYRGALAGIERAEIIEPTTEHSIMLPIDPSDLATRTRVDPIEPTIVFPAASAAAPSIHEFRLEILYSLGNLTAGHPSSDWNIIFDISVTDTEGRVIPLFVQQSWRT